MSAFLSRRNYANSLLVDVNSAVTGLPRRDELREWLKEFIAQPDGEGRESRASATDNLRAINEHLLAFSKATTARPALD